MKKTYDDLVPEHKSEVGDFGAYVKYANDVVFKTPEFAQLTRSVVQSLPPLFTKLTNDAMRSCISQSLGFLCLGGSHPFEELMWAHYADSHRGVSLVFFENHEFFQQSGHKAEAIRKVRPVQYSKQRPTYRDVLLQNFDDDGINAELIQSLFFTKSDVWSYETEMRCIRPFSESDETVTVNGKTFHLFSFPPDALQGVAYGLRCSQEDKQRIREILNNINSEYNLKLVDMQIELHESEYELLLRPYNP
ncbi:MAG: DUF2971 domain-containing protein [Ignavibacteria bacterium]|nr:DUF2971 domain-containing protein [Ignavibacteria bacterium]